MTENARLKLADSIAARMHPHALAAVVGLVIVSAALNVMIWLSQDRVKADLDNCRANLAAYQAGLEKRLAEYAATAAESKREVNALRYDFAESRDTLKALKLKFLTPP